MSREQLNHVRTAVVKIGSSLLASLQGGLDNAFVERTARDIAALLGRDMDIVLVSSGAVAAGTAELGFDNRPTALPEIQAAAAVGQAALMQLYREKFGQLGVTVGQVLLTRDGLQDRHRFLYARQTMRALLDRSVLPIVNENDTVAVEELRLKMGDNDRLAVAVAQLVEAECLVILTDVPGLYDRPPDDENAEMINHVAELTPDLINAAGGSGSGVGSGGMSTKLNAALAASMASIPLVVADGKREGILPSIFAGEDVGTFFSPRAKRTRSRQQWIAFGRDSDGTLVIDDGAVRALVEGKKSLLAIGIRDVLGDFDEADTLRIVALDGREIARGLANFTAEETRQIAGTRNDEHATILGYDCCDTIVHRDNMVVLTEAQQITGDRSP